MLAHQKTGIGKTKLDKTCALKIENCGLLKEGVEEMHG